AQRAPVPCDHPPLKLPDTVKHAAEDKWFFLSEHLLNVGSNTDNRSIESSVHWQRFYATTEYPVTAPPAAACDCIKHKVFRHGALASCAPGPCGPMPRWPFLPCPIRHPAHRNPILPGAQQGCPAAVPGPALLPPGCPLGESSPRLIPPLSP